MKWQILLAVLTSSLAAGSLFWWMDRHSTIARQIVFHKPGLDGVPRGARDKRSKVKIGEFFEYFSNDYDNTLKGEWPNFRGREYTNISNDLISLADSWDAGGPPVLWRQPVGEGYAGAAIFQGRVYILDYLEEQKADALRCLSLTTGRELWRRWYSIDIKRNHGRSRTVPAVNKRHVVTIGPLGHVMCMDSQSGKLRWVLDLVEEYGAEIPQWYMGQCPLLEDDTLVLAPAGANTLLIGIDAMSGRVKWTTPNPDKWKMSHSSIVPMILHGRRIYVYAAVGGVAAVAANGEDVGKLLWKTEYFSPSVVVPSPVRLSNNLIYLSAGYSAGSTTLKIHKRKNGFVVEEGKIFTPKEALSLEQQSAIFYRDTVFGVMSKDSGSKRQQLVGVDPANISRFLVESGHTRKYGLCPFIVADDKFYILDDHGILSMIRFHKNQFKYLGEHKILQGLDPWGPMAIADGLLVIRDSNSLACVDLTKGAHWQKKLKLPSPAPKIQMKPVHKPQRKKLLEKGKLNLAEVSPKVVAAGVEGTLWIGGERGIYYLSSDNQLLGSVDVNFPVQAMAVADEHTVYWASRHQLFKLFRESGTWQSICLKTISQKSNITSLALSNAQIFVADAGQKKLHSFDKKGEHLWSTSGEEGFFIPTPYFDVVHDGTEGVWIVNPGRHRLENYNRQGKYVSTWRPDKEHDFIGCCNPIHIGVLPGGRFVTLEKGIMRLRIFFPSGRLERTVANKDTHFSRLLAHDLAVGGDGRILLLDKTKKRIHEFR